MSRIPHYPKVYNLGHAEVAPLLDAPVIIQEKVDGSQFSFMLDGDGYHFRSKNVDIDFNNPGMFRAAVEAIVQLNLTPTVVYRGEYLSKPKHNTLKYNRVPANHVVLFDIESPVWGPMSYRSVSVEAHRLGLEVVPLLGTNLAGRLTTQTLNELLSKESFLGGPLVEGVVIKQMVTAVPLVDTHGDRLIGKHVSDAFKETNRKTWDHSKAGIIEKVGHQYGTKVRWSKAVLHLAEEGRLEWTPRDIGTITQTIVQDVFEEETADIKDMLFREYERSIRQALTKGAAEWYKQLLLGRALAEEEVPW